MINVRFVRSFVVGVGLAACVVSTSSAQSVVDEWAAVKPPAAPAIGPVTVDPRSTALFIMDFNKAHCSETSRPRCAADAPKIADLLNRARAAKMIIVHTLSGETKRDDMLPILAPRPDERVIRPGLDKFIDAGIVSYLKKHKIKTVILTGTSANGAVMFSAGGAVMRGFDVVAPTDAIPADTTYQEQFTVWNLAHGPDLKDHTKLTRTDLLTIAPASENKKSKP